MRLLGFALLPLLLALPASAQQPRDDVSPADRAFHESLTVLDTHLDIPERWDDGSWDFGARHRWEWDRSQVDLPRMEEGGMDGGFFAIYTPQGALTPEGYREARDAALVRAVAIRRASATRSSTPLPSTGSSSTASAAKRPPPRTDGCSIAETNSRSRGSLRPPISSTGVSASMLASVAPEVKVTLRACAPTIAATCSLALSTVRRAARPSSWTEEAFPGSRSAAVMAASACGRTGAVAFQSR